MNNWYWFINAHKPWGDDTDVTELRIEIDPDTIRESFMIPAACSAKFSSFSSTILFLELPEDVSAPASKAVSESVVFTITGVITSSIHWPSTVNKYGLIQDSQILEEVFEQSWQLSIDHWKTLIVKYFSTVSPSTSERRVK